MVEEQNIAPIPSPQPKFGLQNFNLKIILIGVIFLVIILLTFLFLFLANRAPKEKQVSTTPQITKTPGDSQKFTPAPKVTFRKYEKADNINVSLPSTIKTYTLKTNFSIDEVKSFAQKFGLSSYKEGDKNNSIFFAKDSSDKIGVLSFNNKTGAFTYQSFGNLKFSNTSSQTLTEQARTVLSDLGFTDATISCDITYKRRDILENLTFVECHRSWGALGLPLVNPIGVLNIAENKRILSLRPGMTDPLALSDTAIYSVNTGDNGKARPNDFNTATIVFKSNGDALSIASNLRWIASSTTINSGNILTQDEAMNLFSNHKTTFSYMLPAGAGSIDSKKLYPNNEANAKKAVIQDIALVYIEKSQTTSQDSYVPFYLIRGIAALDSGYTVKFSEIVPALKSQGYSDVSGEEKVAGVSTFLAQEKSLQLGTFEPSQRPESETEYQCKDLTGQSPLAGAKAESTTLSVPPSGKTTIWYRSRSFYLGTTNPSNMPIEDVVKALQKGAQDQFIINVAGYLKKHPETAPPKDKIHAYTFFDKVNIDEGTALNYYPDVSKVYPKQNESRPAPLTPVTAVFLQGINTIPGALAIVDPSFMNVADSVAQEIIDDANSNQIENLASRKDLFAKGSNSHLHWAFVFAQKPSRETCYVSGNSPALFLYPKARTSVSITNSAPLTYTDPPISKNIWNITAEPDGTILDKNNVKRPYLYYEYDPSKVNFVEPDEGFVIETNAVESFIEKDLAPKLGLNNKEKDALMNDVKKELASLKKTPYVKISLLERGEVDKNLPLEIVPQPNIFERVHLMLSPVDHFINIKPQEINAIERKGVTAIELGVYVAR